jgi:hypothetical protein
VLAPVRPLVNPTPKELALCLLQAREIVRRHAILITSYPIPELAVLAISWHNNRITPAITKQPQLRIESQFRFARTLVGAMAGQTALRKKRADFLLKINGLRIVKSAEQHECKNHPLTLIDKRHRATRSRRVTVIRRFEAEFHEFKRAWDTESALK